jgi:putative endonuclease
MSRDQQALAAAGEARAAAYLARRCDNLAARRGRLVVFAEVKTRRSRALGAPETAVDARKQARLARGAAAWLRAHPGVAHRMRFDVIACEPSAGPAGGWRVHHIEGAFDANG